MGITKTEFFTDEQNKLAIMLRALAHPARIAIVQHIISADACICSDLVDELGLAQATIFQHLKELKGAGIIQGSIEGGTICYCIEPLAWHQLQNDLAVFFRSYHPPVKTCC